MKIKGPFFKDFLPHFPAIKTPFDCQRNFVWPIADRKKSPSKQLSLLCVCWCSALFCGWALSLTSLFDLSLRAAFFTRESKREGERACACVVFGALSLVE